MYQKICLFFLVAIYISREMYVLSKKTHTHKHIIQQHDDERENVYSKEFSERRRNKMIHIGVLGIQILCSDN
jgi:hypothetical protein